MIGKLVEVNVVIYYRPNRELIRDALIHVGLDVDDSNYH